MTFFLPQLVTFLTPAYLLTYLCIISRPKYHTMVYAKSQQILYFPPKKNYVMSESSLAICQLIITKLFAQKFVMKFENDKEIVKMTKKMRFR